MIFLGVSLYCHSRDRQYWEFLSQKRILFFALFQSIWLLSLQIIFIPDPWLAFSTNLFGSFASSISSTLSHTPIRGIRYFSPIVFLIYSLTLYLSAKNSPSFMQGLSFSQWIFSLNRLGLFMFSQRCLYPCLRQTILYCRLKNILLYYLMYF